MMYDERMTAPMPEKKVIELVGMREIADRLKVPRSTASAWHVRRATTGFPAPLEELSMGPVFDWADVKAWYEGRQP